MVDKNKYINIGEIYREHGVRGQCKFYSYDSTSKNLKKDEAYILQKDDGTECSVKVLEVAHFNRYFLVHFDKFDAPEQVVPFRKAVLWFEKSRLSRREGEILDFELIGLTVADMDGNKIGKINSIISNPTKQLVLAPHDKNTGTNDDIMIPYIEDWIVKMDLENGLIVMNLPQGLV